MKNNIKTMIDLLDQKIKEEQEIFENTTDERKKVSQHHYIHGLEAARDLILNNSIF